MSALNQRLQVKEAESGWYMGKSTVAGQGVFADKDYEADEVIDLAMTQKSKKDDDFYGASTFDLTPLARYCNHQNKNNVVIKKDGDSFNLVTSKPVEKDSEFFADYRQVGRALGPFSQMLWEGKPVPTTDFSDYVEKESEDKKKKLYHSCCGKPAGECAGCNGPMTLVSEEDLDT